MCRTGDSFIYNEKYQTLHSVAIEVSMTMVSNAENIDGSRIVAMHDDEHNILLRLYYNNS